LRFPWLVNFVEISRYENFVFIPRKYIKGDEFGLKALLSDQVLEALLPKFERLVCIKRLYSFPFQIFLKFHIGSFDLKASV
jgi:hypothetical protein